MTCCSPAAGRAPWLAELTRNAVSGYYHEGRDRGDPRGPPRRAAAQPRCRSCRMTMSAVLLRRAALVDGREHAARAAPRRPEATTKTIGFSEIVAAEVGGREVSGAHGGSFYCRSSYTHRGIQRQALRRCSWFAPGARRTATRPSPGSIPSIAYHHSKENHHVPSRHLQGPAARRRGPAAASTSTRSCATCPRASAAPATRRPRRPRPAAASSVASSAAADASPSAGRRVSRARPPGPRRSPRAVAT